MTREFYCCEKKCTKFETEAFVQLGYNGNATPLVFMPQLGANGISIPDRGSVVDEHTLANLQPLKLAPRRAAKPRSPRSTSRYLAASSFTDAHHTSFTSLHSLSYFSFLLFEILRQVAKRR